MDQNHSKWKSCLPLRWLFVFVSLVVLVQIYFYLDFGRWNEIYHLTTSSNGSVVQKFVLNLSTHVYELDGKPIIWQYWNDEETPIYVRLLVEAMQCRNGEFRTILVHNSTVRQYLPDLKLPDDLWNLLTPVNQADLFRVFILLRYGGVYSDVDVFASDKIRPLYSKLSHFDVVTSNWGGEMFALGAIGPVRADLDVFKLWYGGQLRKIEEKFTPNLTHDPFGWSELLLKPMPKFSDVNWTKYLPYDGQSAVVQWGYANSKLDLISKPWYPLEEIKPMFPLRWSPFLYLYGAAMREKFKSITNVRELLMPSNASIYSSFVGCALMDCYPDFKSALHLDPNAKTSVTRMNIGHLIEPLENLDPEICHLLKTRRDNDKNKEKLGI